MKSDLHIAGPTEAKLLDYLPETPVARSCSLRTFSWDGASATPNTPHLPIRLPARAARERPRSQAAAAQKRDELASS